MLAVTRISARSRILPRKKLFSSSGSSANLTRRTSLSTLSKIKQALSRYFVISIGYSSQSQSIFEIFSLFSSFYLYVKHTHTHTHIPLLDQQIYLVLNCLRLLIHHILSRPRSHAINDSPSPKLCQIVYKVKAKWFACVYVCVRR